MTTETKTAFARRIGQHKSTVTRLAQAGRLVLTVDGRVLVEESLALMQGTQGTRDDVADRHAQAREEKARQGAPVQPEGQGGEEERAEGSLEEARRTKAIADARRMVAQADREEMERDRLAGDLIAREDVDAAMKFIGATVRGLLDVFPDQTAPLVAPVQDLAECHAILSQSCRDVLVRLGEAIEKQRRALDSQ